MTIRFYQCDICGKVIAILSDTGVPTVCCGQDMRELIPNVTDGAFEKHVPVFRTEGCTVNVQVGSAPHPMKEDHYISLIGLRTDRGFQFKELKPGDQPEAAFTMTEGEQAQAVYAFCNLHGLWCSETEAAHGS